MPADLKAVLAALGEFGDTFQQANEVDPAKLTNVGSGMDNAASLGFLSGADQMYVRAALRKLPTSDLEMLFTRQLTLGIGKGRPADSFFASPTVQQAMGQSYVTAALDTTGGAALIRQDLDPMLQEYGNCSLGW